MKNQEFDLVLAKTFANEIRLDVTGRQFVEIAEQDKDEFFCISHNFCDANQSMINALEYLGFDYSDCGDRINAAWDIARENNFFIDSYGREHILMIRHLNKDDAKKIVDFVESETGGHFKHAAIAETVTIFSGDDSGTDITMSM